MDFKSLAKFEPVGILIGVDTNLYRSAQDQLKTDDTLFVARLIASTNSPLTPALVSAIQGGSGIEFGHSNPNGYRNTLGAQSNSGAGFLAFHAEHGSSINTYRTRGVLGSIIEADLGGGLRFLKAGVLTADNQVPTVLGILNASGQLRIMGELRAQLGLSGQVLVGDDPTIARIYFGSALDTVLYRSAAAELKTDGVFVAKQGLTVEGLVHFTNNADVLLDSGYNLTIDNGGRLVQKRDAGSGKVLTSDAAGLGTWQNPSPEVWVGPNPPNAVTNPGFEVDTAGWITTGPGYALNVGAAITRIISQARSGIAAAQIVTTAALAFQGVSFTVGVLPAGTYKFSMYLKGANGGEQLQGFGGHASAAWGLSSQAATTSWAQCSGTFVADGVGACYIGVRNTVPAAYTFYVDDFEISLATADISKTTLWIDTDDPDPTVEAPRFIGASGQPVFTNSWANYDAGVGLAGRSAYFYKDRGRVYLGGVIKNGASGAAAFALPTGYLPAMSPTVPVVASGGLASLGINGANGNVTPQNVTAGTSVTGYCFLDGISFLAA